MDKRTCFVISPIGEPDSDVRRHADDVFEYIIKLAMEECEIEPFRSDQLEEPGRISDQMFRAIFQSDLCIAVLTGHNPNVFYELAMAQSAMRPTVLLIENGQSLPFDIKDLRSIVYDLGIRSFKDRRYIEQLINFVRQIEINDWQTEDLFAPYRDAQRSGSPGLNFFAASGDFGNESNWLALLAETTHRFDVMGKSLTAWRRTKDFGHLLNEKADKGARIRVLLCDPDNGILEHLNYHDFSLESVQNDIRDSLTYFSKLAQHENIEVRTIKRSKPNFFLTATDSSAVIIQYLSGLWGTGPLWRCDSNAALYDVATAEFDSLWQLNAGDSLEAGPSV